MGTTYHAQFDILVNGQSWEPLSRWMLQKDYSFAIAWSKVAEHRLPSDAKLIGVEKSSYGYDFDEEYHGRGELLVSLQVTSSMSQWIHHMQLHVKSLIACGHTVRVLVWGV